MRLQLLRWKRSKLPPHRLHYLDYEGPISGDRGEVRRVDRGEYEALRDEEATLKVRLYGDQIRAEVPLRRGMMAALATVAGGHDLVDAGGDLL